MGVKMKYGMLVIIVFGVISLGMPCAAQPHVVSWDPRQTNPCIIVNIPGQPRTLPGLAPCDASTGNYYVIENLSGAPGAVPIFGVNAPAGQPFEAAVGVNNSNNNPLVWSETFFGAWNQDLHYLSEDLWFTATVNFKDGCCGGESRALVQFSVFADGHLYEIDVDLFNRGWGDADPRPEYILVGDSEYYANQGLFLFTVIDGHALGYGITPGFTTHIVIPVTALFEKTSADNLIAFPAPASGWRGNAHMVTWGVGTEVRFPTWNTIGVSSMALWSEGKPSSAVRKHLTIRGRGKLQ
jgi:hypothetical protein